jgi:alpha-beta hydrolase superfamily lysophospholipase
MTHTLPRTVEPREGALEGVGGLRIFRQSWCPVAVRAVVVLSHGASEHSTRYAWVAERLAERGYATHAVDHRGHGRSEGGGAYIDRMDHVVEDLDSLVHSAAAEHPDAPLFMLGHSMGGCVALAYALRHQDKLDGLILSAPLAALEAASLPQRVAGRVLSVVAPRLGVFDIDSAGVSRDPAVVRDYDSDPLNHHGKLPARTVAELANTISAFHDAVPRLTLPMLLMHGTDDRIVPLHGTEMVEERVSSEDKTFIRYDGLFHEILNEPERERVVGDIADWLDERT